MDRIIIETPRLLLREWTADDTADLAVLSEDPRVMRYITGGEPLTRAQTHLAVARLMETAQVKGWCRWALQLREPTAADPSGVAGFCGPGCSFAPEIELGWWLHPRLWDRGLATEAGRAALDFCFTVIGFEQLVCMVHPENTASLKVAKNVGFTPRGTAEWKGQVVIRHVADNPLAHPPNDPTYVRDCTGVATQLSAPPEET